MKLAIVLEQAISSACLPIFAVGEGRDPNTAREQFTGTPQILLGVGLGGGDAGERFVEDADDPPLFGQRRDRYRQAC